MSKYWYDEGEIFVLVGLHGFFWEIIVSGIVLSSLLKHLVD